MTFSVDVDLWSVKTGPTQDATPRQSASDGRGKDFAGSLFGVSSEIEAAVQVPTGSASTLHSTSLTLASLGFMAAPATQTPAEAPPISDAELGAPLSQSAPVIPEAPSPNATETAQPAPQASSDFSAAHPDPDPGMDEADPEGLITAIQPDSLEKEDALRADTAPLPDDTSALPLAIAAAPAAVPQSQPLPATTAPIRMPAPALAAAGKLRAEATDAPSQPSGALSADAPSQPEPSGVPVPPAEQPIDPLTPFSASPIDAPRTEGSADLAANHPLTDTSASTAPTPPAAPLVGPAASAAPQPGMPAQVAASMQPVSATLVATTSQLPQVVARATADAGDDRVVIQLDPPELGRVSLDFKFDAQGLQHVTVTAESPEAMRQLRLMHFELVQALERNGLSGQNMSFQHQNPQQQNPWAEQARVSGARYDAPSLTGDGLVIAADAGQGRQLAANGRLDIRL